MERNSRSLTWINQTTRFAIPETDVVRGNLALIFLPQKVCSMKTDLTDITIVIDRSGSMASIREDAEGGINTFVSLQKKEPGEALLTLVQFDTDYEFVHTGIPIGMVPGFTLTPRGATALLDAVGRAINETGARLAAIEESQRPALVIFVIVTDGHENSSQQFTRDQIRRLIEHQTDVYKWQFTFLAANQDAFAEASTLGISAAGTANWTTDKVGNAHVAASAKVARMRRSASAGETIDNNFTDEERRSMQ